MEEAASLRRRRSRVKVIDDVYQDWLWRGEDSRTNQKSAFFPSCQVIHGFSKVAQLLDADIDSRTNNFKDQVLDALKGQDVIEAIKKWQSSALSGLPGGESIGPLSIFPTTSLLRRATSLFVTPVDPDQPNSFPRVVHFEDDAAFGLGRQQCFSIEARDLMSSMLSLVGLDKDASVEDLGKRKHLFVCLNCPFIEFTSRKSGETLYAAAARYWKEHVRDLTASHGVQANGHRPCSSIIT